jgi:malate dehydrogenase
MVLGEHGDGIVPLWSSVAVQGFSDTETARAIRSVRSSTTSGEFPSTLDRMRTEIIQVAETGNIAEAFRRFDLLPPDIRVMIGPFLTLYSGSKTDVATANASIDLIKAILSGRDTIIAAQVCLGGEFLGVSGPIGAPVLLTPKGWETVYPLSLTTGEEELFRQSAASLQRKLVRWNA